jgi:hypothetical protein
MNKIGEVGKTILEQLKAENPLFRSDYGVKAILLLEDDSGIRLHTKNGRKVINIDIKYDSGSDLYQVEFHKQKGKYGLTWETKTLDGVFFDQLNRLIQKELSKELWE